MKQAVAAVVVCAAVFSHFANAAAGRTAGAFAVSPTGAATYTIPIWVPPGPKGVQPTIALSYYSGAEGNAMGPGWALSGLGSILRCNLTVAQDVSAMSVQLLQSDGYCLNGNRLRLSTGTYGAGGSTYGTEIADFSLITANGSAGNGPASFTVQAKNGWTYEYGNTADSSVTPTYPATTVPTPYQWFLHKARDRAGNNYVVTYGAGATGSAGIAVPLSIAYTPASAGSGSYNYTVNFAYTPDNTNGTEIAYVAGNQTINTNLLTAVTVKSGATTIRKYSLDYQLAPVTSRKRLQTVTECADDPGSNCLSPTTITYSDGAAGLATTASTAVTGNYTVLGVQDYNGDKRADILYSDTGSLKVAFATSSGFATPVTVASGTGLAASLAVSADMAGIGQSDILVPVSGVWWRYTYNGSSFAGSSTGYSVQTNINQAALLDIDGDGRPDLVEAVRTTPTNSMSLTVYSRLNTTSGTTFSLSSTLTNSYSVTESCNTTFKSNCSLGISLTSALRTPVRMYDFNGDRRSDLVLTWSYFDLVNTETVSEVDTLMSNGTTFSVGTTVNGASFATAADANSDGCTDLAMDYGSLVSACNGQSASWITTGSAAVGSLDWDSDGRTDLLLNNGSYLSVQLATGGTPITTSIPNTNFFIGDFDGDGQPDFGAWDATGIYYRYHNYAGSIPGASPVDYATTFADGFGLTNTVTYASTALSNYTAGSVPSGVGEVVLDQPMAVVGQVVTTDGTGGSYTQTFNYTGGVLNFQGRGFEGFQAVNVSDSRANAPAVTTSYRTAFPLTGMPYRIKVFQHNGTTLISQTDNDTQYQTLSSTTYQQQYSPYDASATVNAYEVGGAKNAQLITTQFTTFTPDTYGNFATVATTATDMDATSPYFNQQWSSTTVSSYSPNTANWCIGLPTQVAVTNSAPGAATLTRTTGYVNDYPLCRPTNVNTEPTNALQRLHVDRALTYDAFGNLSQLAVTGYQSNGSAMTQRVSTTDWGTTGQFPVYVRDALSNSLGGAGYKVTLGYDYTLGVLGSRTVQSADGATNNAPATTWSYDAFGRQIQENRPDGTYTATDRSACNAGNGYCGVGDLRLDTHSVSYTSTGSVISQQYLCSDMYGRLRYDERTNINGSLSYVVTSYDAYGNVSSKSVPWSSTPYWTTYSYDPLNRVTQMSQPISASNGTLKTTSYAYEGRTTRVTDPQGKSKTLVKTIAGALGRTQDHNGYYVGFTYDAFGSLLTATDSNSVPLFYSASYEYSDQALQRAMTDADLGPRSYNYDSLGELTSWSDANGQSFSAQYDALSRMISRTEPDLTSAWNYGTTAASHNVGQLQSTSAVNGSQNYSESYTYDSAARPATRQIVSDATYQYDYAYSSTTGFLDTLTYPTSTSGYRLAVKYLYQNGYLQQVKDANSSQVFWTVNTMNPAGQLTQETLGNGIVNSHVYDAANGYLSSIVSTVGGTTLQNNAYLFDLVGNLTQRQDNLQTLTENAYYDNLYRLEHTALNSTTNWAQTYDGNGNMLSQQDTSGTVVPRLFANTGWTSNCTSSYGNAQPHALKMGWFGTFGIENCYDANGNFLKSLIGTTALETATWTSYNLPSAINLPFSPATNYLSYNQDHQRWRQEATSTSVGTEITIYVGGLMEKVSNGSGTTYRHYISAGSNQVVYSRSSAGSNSTYFLTTDHLGSTSLVTDNSGSVLVNESFAPWGGRRSSNWAGTPSTADYTQITATTRQGFTGQEQMDVVNEVNMNGRVNWAGTSPGWFASPDPYISDPTNTQNFNRYSYVYNSPLSHSDPTGFETDKARPTLTGSIIPGVMSAFYSFIGNSPFPAQASSGSPAGSTGNGDNTSTASGASITVECDPSFDCSNLNGTSNSSDAGLLALGFSANDGLLGPGMGEAFAELDYGMELLAVYGTQALGAVSLGLGIGVMVTKVCNVCNVPGAALGGFVFDVTHPHAGADMNYFSSADLQQIAALARYLSH